MRNKTQTLKNMKRLKQMIEKIIDNDNKRTQTELPPSLNETLQKITEEMNKWEDRVEQVEQDAIHGKFVYKNNERFSPEQVLNKLDNYNQVITQTIDQVQNIFPNSKIPPEKQQKNAKTNKNSKREKRNFKINVKKANRENHQ